MNMISKMVVISKTNNFKEKSFIKYSMGIKNFYKIIIFIYHLFHRIYSCLEFDIGKLFYLVIYHLVELVTSCQNVEVLDVLFHLFHLFSILIVV